MTIVSLALRLGLLVALVDVLEPLYDEGGYLYQAWAWAHVLTGAEHGIPQGTFENRFYGSGRWPPGNALVLALGMIFGGFEFASGRWAVAVFSALSTGLTVVLADRLVGRRAAVAAGALHLLYPSFVAFSHYAWSESAFIFFLLLAVWLAVACVEARRVRRALMVAAGCGLVCGFLMLLRAPGAPMVLALIAWLALQGDDLRRRVACAALVGVAATLVILPWQTKLAAEEGGFVFLSTYGAYNLALGNHPSSPPEFGSSWSHPSKASLDAELAQRRGTHGETLQRASLAVARAEVSAHPLLTVRRAAGRLRMLWAPDFFFVRHLARVVYPPLPQAWLLPIAGAVLLAYLALVALGLHGLWSPSLRHRSLILLLLFAGMVLPLLTVAMSRFHLPLLALLLPAAGQALVARPVVRWRRSALLFVAFLMCTAPSWRLVTSTYLTPSSHYATSFAKLDRWLGTNTVTSDVIELRRDGQYLEPLVVRLASPHSIFATRTTSVPWPGELEVLSLEVLTASKGPTVALTISAPAGAAATWTPVRAETWKRWQPSPLAGVSWRWEGSGYTLFADELTPP